MPGSPTGFKLINLLTPTPSDNRGSTRSKPPLSLSLSLSVCVCVRVCVRVCAWVCFWPFSPASIQLQISRKRLLLLNTHNIKAIEGYFHVLMQPGRIVQVQHAAQKFLLSLYLHASVWEKLFSRQLSAQIKVFVKKGEKKRVLPCASLRTKSTESMKGHRLLLTADTYNVTLLSLLMCISSGWKQTPLIRCQLGTQ